MHGWTAGLNSGPVSSCPTLWAAGLLAVVDVPPPGTGRSTPGSRCVCWHHPPPQEFLGNMALPGRRPWTEGGAMRPSPPSKCAAAVPAGRQAGESGDQPACRQEPTAERAPAVLSASEDAQAER